MKSNKISKKESYSTAYFSFSNSNYTILDSHLFHILFCNLYHKVIGQAWFVLRFETDGYVADRFTDPWV